MARGGFSSSDFLSITNPSGVLDLTAEAFTIAAWVKFSAITDTKFVARYDGFNGYGLLCRSTGVIAGFVVNGGGADSANSPASSVTTGQWYHVAGVKNGTGANALKTYLNGSQVASITSNRGVPDTSLDFMWGRRSGATAEALSGEVSGSAVWSAVLTAAEIAALAGGVSPLLVHPSNLAWYEGWGVGSSGEADLSGTAQNLVESGTVTVTNHAPVCPPFPLAA